VGGSAAAGGGDPEIELEPMRVHRSE
jgi:hypothetical protein